MTSSIRSHNTQGHISRCENYSNVGNKKTPPGKYQKGMHIKNADKEATLYGEKILSQNPRLDSTRARLQDKLYQGKLERERTVAPVGRVAVDTPEVDYLASIIIITKILKTLDY